MSNSAAKAEAWTEFLASRPEFPRGERLRAALRAGKITRLCDCGCNSYDVEVPEGRCERIAAPGGSGAVFEISFSTEGASGSLELIVFVDAHGQLAGVEVDYCANSFPVPDNVQIKEPPYHVEVSRALEV
jgi:hypothetical protein